MTALPERLEKDGLHLALVDVAVALGVLLIAAIVGEARPAALALTTCLFASMLLGRYRWSFAVSSLDERHAVIGVGSVSMLALAALIPIFAVSAIGALATVVVWCFAAGAFAIRFTAARRARSEVAVPVCCRLDPRSRARARDGLLRATIRLVDFLLAAFALLLLSPVMFACAIAVYREDRHSPIFAQRRIGLDGHAFTMYKFRTMRTDAGLDWAKTGDDRVTKAGAFLRRTSLDELPQLWNVLRGEMSLVGPRPEMSEYADRFAERIPNYHDRHAVAPGITGWAQIHYDRNFPPEESERVVPYDRFYVANYSLPLYFYCLIKTAGEVATHHAV